MPYYMRYFDTSSEPLAMEDIEAAIKRENPAYWMEIFKDGQRPLADLYLGDALFAQIELNQPGDGLFDEEIREMLDALLDAEGYGRQRVESVLKDAKRT